MNTQKYIIWYARVDTFSIHGYM